MAKVIHEETVILNGKTDHIFIGGFSQGCMLSLATFLKLKEPEPLGGLACYSGG